jgi:hypothetical protein
MSAMYGLSAACDMPAEATSAVAPIRPSRVRLLNIVPPRVWLTAKFVVVDAGLFALLAFGAALPGGAG